MDHAEPHRGSALPLDGIQGLLKNLPFGADFLGSNWLLILVLIVAAVLYFWLGRSQLPLFDLLGGFFK